MHEIIHYHAMKKLFLFCIFSLLTTTTAPAYNIVQPQLHLQIGTEIYTEQYREYSDNALFMQENARMFGLYTQLSMPFKQYHAIDLMTRLAVGSSRYTGAEQNDHFGSIVASNLDRYVWETRAMYELTLPDTNLSPLIGAGYRRLVDRLDQLNSGGYKRISQYFYTSLGIKAEIRLSQQWQLIPQLLYHHLLHGKQQSQTGSWSLEHKQDKGHGIEFSADFKRVLNNDQAIRLTPYYKYWHIADSHISTQHHMQTIEPENKTHEIGIKMDYTF